MNFFAARVAGLLRQSLCVSRQLAAKARADAKWKPPEKVTDDEIKVLMKLVRSFKTVVPNH